MAAVIARKNERHAALNVGIPNVGGRLAAGEKKRRQQKMSSPHAYQSSLTTRTASSLIASRAATSVVTIASASNTSEKTASPDHGTDRSMLQWNDCRFTT